MKRSFDILISLIMILALALPMIVIYITVRLFLGRPAIFKQIRPGLRGQAFMMYKFRSMTGARGADGKLLPDSQRLTALGRFLRTTSLDELPELFNVFVGDMSLVGPRPLLMEYLPRYNAEQMRRHEVRPGITGWAQINGRNAISWEEKFKLDVWYVDNQSLLLDIKILLLTVLKVFRREGVNSGAHETMPLFRGSSK